MKKKQDGVAVTNETATPLHSGMHPYWAAHWKNVVLEYLSDSHPNVEVDYDKGGGGHLTGRPADNPRFRAVFRKDDPSGREMCGPSRSLANPKTAIPESEIDALVDSLDRFHKEAENAANTDGARQFVREYRVPDPRQMRDAWRVGRSGRFKRLLLLWGYHPNGAANDVVLPLTETSRSWDDAKRRVDLKEALREAGRIGGGRIDWGWVLSRALLGILILLLLALIGCGIYYSVITDPPRSGPPTGGGMVSDNGSTSPGAGLTVGGGIVSGGRGASPGASSMDNGGMVSGDGDASPGAGSADGGDMESGGGGALPGADSMDGGGIVSGGGGALPGVGLTDDGNATDDNGTTDGGDETNGDDETDEGADNGGTTDGGDETNGDDETDEGTDNGGITDGGDETNGDDETDDGTDNYDMTDGGTMDGSNETNDDTTVISPDSPVHFCPIHNVKLINGKCPKFCTKHPDIHLDKDGKCRICEGAEPPPPPDCSIVLQDRGEKGDGSFQPTFKLISQNELPGNATIAWSIDGGSDQALGETFTPRFPDASPHTIKAVVEWVDDGTLRKVSASLPWNPAPADERIVNRDIVQIQKRNVGHETIYIYALTSDAESGRATVRSWSVERRQDDKPPRKLKSDTEMNGQHLLVHGKDIAGEANLTIVAEVSLGKGETTKVEKTFRFRYDIVTKSESVSDDETIKLSTAGNGVVPSVYLVLTGSGIGTAFAVDNRKLVTNAHVVDPIRPGGKVTLFQANSPMPIEGIVRFSEPKRDLALISVSGVDLSPIPLAESFSANQSVACVGFPFSTLEAEKAPDGGFVPAVSVGTINGVVDSDDLASLDGPNQYKGFMVTSDALSNPGNSGSPVVDESGRLIGVLRSGIYSKDKDNMDGRASGLIPLSAVRDFLKRHSM